METKTLPPDMEAIIRQMASVQLQVGQALLKKGLLQTLPLGKSESIAAGATFIDSAERSLSNVRSVLRTEPVAQDATNNVLSAPALRTEPGSAEQSLSNVRSVLRTEDTGKIFERAICLAYNTPYVGPYKYGLEKPMTLVPRLTKLTEIVPACVHTAARASRYDFTSADSHISAKTSKRRGAKVAPQVIGQCKPAKFCELVGITYEDVPTLKHWIQTHVTDVLPVLAAHTFDCLNVYWNAETDAIKVVRLREPIDWVAVQADAWTWTCSAEAWANSSTLQFRGIALVEFQFHTKSRTNMAIRWCYDNFLTLFRENLDITDL